jgi:hypothetical protein
MHNSINPSSLTDKELLRFAEELAHTGGMPVAMQIELVKRFAHHVI